MCKNSHNVEVFKGIKSYREVEISLFVSFSQLLKQLIEYKLIGFFYEFLYQIVIYLVKIGESSLVDGEETTALDAALLYSIANSLLIIVN